MKLEKSIAENAKLVADLGSEEKDSYQRWQLLKRQQKKRQDLVKQVERETRSVEGKIRSLKDQIEESNAKIQVLSDEFGRLLRSSHRLQLIKPAQFFLLSAKGINDALLRWRYLRQVSRSRKKLFGRLAKLKEDLVVQRAELEKKKTSLIALLKKREEELHAIEKDAKQLDGVVKDLRKEKSKVNKRLKKLKNEREALNKRIAAILKANREGSTSTKIVKALSSSFEKNKGRLPWPVNKAVVLRGVGTHAHPLQRTIKIQNNGVDLRVGKEKEVRAIFDGEVFAVVKMQGYNHVIGIQHGIYTSIYTAKLEKIAVKQGQKVKVGTRIGRLYQSEDDKSSSFHFELWKDKEVLDPEEWLR